MNDAPQNETPSIETLMNELAQLTNEGAIPTPPVIHTEPEPETRLPEGIYQTSLTGQLTIEAEVRAITMDDLMEAANQMAIASIPQEVRQYPASYNQSISPGEILPRVEIQERLQELAEQSEQRVEAPLLESTTTPSESLVYHLIDFPTLLGVPEGLIYELEPWQTGSSHNLVLSRAKEEVHYKLVRFLDALEISLRGKYDVHVLGRNNLFVVLDMGDKKCTNSAGMSYVIKDMYISFYIGIERRRDIDYVSISHYTGGFSYNFRCSKLYFTRAQYDSGLIHPHAPTFNAPSINKVQRLTGFSHEMCLGHSELRELITSMSQTEHFSTTQFSLFLYTVSSFLEWDSPNHYPSAKIENFTKKKNYTSYSPPACTIEHVFKSIANYCFTKNVLEIPIVKTDSGIEIERNFLLEVIGYYSDNWCLTDGNWYYFDSGVDREEETHRVPGFIFRNENRELVIERETEENLTKVIYPQIIEHYRGIIKSMSVNNSDFINYIRSNDNRNKENSKIDNIKLRIESDSELVQQVSYAGMEWATLV